MLVNLTFKNINPRFVSEETANSFTLRPNFKDEFWEGLGLESDTILLNISKESDSGFYWSDSFNFDYDLDYSNFELIVSSWKQNMGPDGFNVSEITFSNEREPKKVYSEFRTIGAVMAYVCAELMTEI